MIIIRGKGVLSAEELQAISTIVKGADICAGNVDCKNCPYCIDEKCTAELIAKAAFNRP